MDIILRASEIPPDLLEFFEPIEWGTKSDTWTLGPEPYEGSHYAVMPTKLVEPCVLAGTSAKGCCAQCGAPWERVVEREASTAARVGGNGNWIKQEHLSNGQEPRAGGFYDAKSTTTGWRPTCLCNADVIPCTVLDCFFGSGTVGSVALKHGRHFVGIDLDERNLKLARTRIEQAQPMLFDVTA